MKKGKTKTINTLHDDTSDINEGFLQHEIDNIVEESSPTATVAEVEKKVIAELKKELPAEEVVTAKTDPHHHHDIDIIVRNTTGNAPHSPYVLDLSEMMARKRREEEKKQKVANFLSTPKRTASFFSRKKSAVTSSPKQTLLLSNSNQKPPTIIAEKKQALYIEAPKPKRVKTKFKISSVVSSFQLPAHWYRSVLTYAVLCLFLIIPIKGFSYYKELQKSQDQIVEYATSAYQDLKVASGALSDNNFDTAGEKFAEASNNFSDADTKLNNINAVLKTILKVIPTNSANLSDAEYLLDAGKQVSGIGQELTNALNAFSFKRDAPLTDKISYFQANLDKIIPKLQTIDNNLHKVRTEAIPADKQETFQAITTYVSTLTTDLKELSSLSDSLYDILGRDNLRRYLFVFQNNNEQRPTGGFIGSYALVDIDRGEIKKIEMPGGGSYSAQGQLKENIVSPYPLHLVNARWELQDANWFPDFPTSAEKIKWFYEKSGGPTIDGVIAINASLIPKLLEITKPIDLPAYGKTLSAANFIDEVQQAVEFEYDKTVNKPKQILSDLAPELLKRIFETKGDDILKIAKTFKTGLDEKDIQLYFTNEAVQTKFADYNWTGEMKNSSKDYLAVVNTNIRGYKTDAYIKQNINVVSDITENGEITNTLTIERTHTGSGTTAFDRQSNIDYLRVYVPAGSKLISAQGFSELPKNAFEAVDPDWKTDALLEKVQGKVSVEPDSNTSINTEFDKTVFGNWIQTDPGQTQKVVIIYKLPFQLTKAPDNKQWYEFYKANPQAPFYSLFLQKQSGTQNANYDVTVNFPANYKVTWSYPDRIAQSGNTINLQTNLNKDELMAFVLN